MEFLHIPKICSIFVITLVQLRSLLWYMCCIVKELNYYASCWHINLKLILKMFDHSHNKGRKVRCGGKEVCNHMEDGNNCLSEMQQLQTLLINLIILKLTPLKIKNDCKKRLYHKKVFLKYSKVLHIQRFILMKNIINI